MCGLASLKHLQKFQAAEVLLVVTDSGYIPEVL